MKHAINEILSKVIISNKQSLNNFIDQILVDNLEIFITFVCSKEEEQSIISEISALKTRIISEIIKKYPQYKVYITFKNQVKTKVDNAKLKVKKNFSNIKNIIAVASGKGGVGKSTFTVNLAYMLSQQNLKVGILDGDIYGPSIAFMMGNKNIKTNTVNEDSIPTFEVDGIKYNSIASFLKDEDSAVVLKAPMAIKVFNQMINSDSWGELDVLLIDLPPGTGDIHINLCLNFDLTGVIMICTPQKLALLDAIKAINMYKQVNTNILGIVENMSSFECPNCGSVSDIFDSKQVEAVSSKNNIDFLGNIPISLGLRQLSDNNNNLVKNKDDSIVSFCFKNITSKIIAKIKK